jgi:hypothetical protein
MYSGLYGAVCRQGRARIARRRDPIRTEEDWGHTVDGMLSK